MHDATEEYLETILEIEEEGIVPIRARLVERLGLSAAAVSEQVNRLVSRATPSSVTTARCA
jgi:DtxR family Mn-dependent transcriptional regulator